MGGSLSDLVPELQPYASDLVTLAGQNGLQPRVTSTVRGHSEQARLYRRFLAGQSGYPVAPPGQSAHEYGEAFDLVVSPMDYLADLGSIWRSWGGGWNPADAIHFELPGASERAASQPAIEALTPAGLTKAADVLVGFTTLGIPQTVADIINSLYPNAAADFIANPYTFLRSQPQWVRNAVAVLTLGAINVP